MKIIEIEDFFHPSAGYQINVLSKFLAKKHDVTIITSEIEKAPKHLLDFFGASNIPEKDEAYSKKYKVKILRLPILRFVSSRAIFRKKALFEAIKRERGDILFVHGNDTFVAIQCFRNYKKLKMPMISDSHMLAMASRNPFSSFFRLFYRLAVTPIIRKHQIIVVRNQNDDFINRHYQIPSELTPFISFGVDTTLFFPNEEMRKERRKDLKIREDDLVFVYAGKLDVEKGSLFFSRAIMKKFSSPKITFLIIGNTSGAEAQETEENFAKSENRIIRIPTLPYEELPKYYQLSDVSVFPAQCSLSFFDVQACGLPVISEDNSINKERNSNGNGICFEQGDSQSLRNAIEQFIQMDKIARDEMKKKSAIFASTNFGYSKVAELFLEFIEQCISKQRL